jgi:cobalamin biosynthesis protein CobD/CbiB
MIFLNPEMSGSLSAAVLALACAVDSIMGDPRWLPHPVRLIGTLITYGEGILRKCAHDPFSERIAGIVLTSVIVSLTYGITYCLQNYCLAFFDETKGHMSISAVIGL